MAQKKKKVRKIADLWEERRAQLDKKFSIIKESILLRCPLVSSSKSIDPLAPFVLRADARSALETG